MQSAPPWITPRRPVRDTPAALTDSSSWLTTPRRYNEIRPHTTRHAPMSSAHFAWKQAVHEHDSMSMSLSVRQLAWQAADKHPEIAPSKKTVEQLVNPDSESPVSKLASPFVFERSKRCAVYGKIPSLMKSKPPSPVRRSDSALQDKTLDHTSHQEGKEENLSSREHEIDGGTNPSEPSTQAVGHDRKQLSSRRNNSSSAVRFSREQQQQPPTDLPPRSHLTSPLQSKRALKQIQATADKAREAIAMSADATTKYNYFWDFVERDDDFLRKFRRRQANQFNTGGRDPGWQDRHAAAQSRADTLMSLWRRQAAQKLARVERNAKLQHAHVVEEARAAAERAAQEERRRAVEEERKVTVARLSVRAFKALCTDPVSGLPTDPREVFRRLDADKSGSVDIDEFQNGLYMCGCRFTKEEIDLLWSMLDGEDGERDGQVDYDVLVRKLQEVNVEALLRLKPYAIDRMRAASITALDAVFAQVARHGRDVPLTAPEGPAAAAAAAAVAAAAAAVTPRALAGAAHGGLAAGAQAHPPAVPAAAARVYRLPAAGGGGEMLRSRLPPPAAASTAR